MSEKNAAIIGDICRRIDITPERKILLDGKPATPELQNAYITQPSNKMLFDMLEGVLYSRFYSGSQPEMAQQLQENWMAETNQFIDTLSQANQSVERFDSGWTVHHIDMQGQITARKGNYMRVVYPGEFVNETGFSRKPGEREMIRLFSRKEHRDPSTGFYYVFGNNPGEDNSSQLARLYFNIQPAGATLLVKEISTELNKYNIPFSFKCLNHPAWYMRRDSAVLYIEKRYTGFVFRLITGIYSRLKKYMEDSIPLFSKKLAKGLAFAENPVKSDESFGTHCCKMITQGMLAAYHKKVPREKWPMEIKYTIEQVHHYPDWEQLYINPGSQFPYTFPVIK